MPIDKIEFTFKLGLPHVPSPTPVQFLFNDTIVHDTLLKFDSNIISFVANLEYQKSYCLKFQLLELPKTYRVMINNIGIRWVIDQDSRNYFKPGWRSASPNEIWNYTDPDATDIQNQQVLQSMGIELDYMVGKYPGFIKKFGRFEPVNGEVVSFSNINKPYNITVPGTFKIDFTSPISYWLYENLI